MAKIEEISLTVAIPTYNRAVPLGELVDVLIPLVESGLIYLLIVDDGSTDTTSRLPEKYVHPGITWVRNSTNVGYAQNFLRCFDLASTRYLVMVSDDDVFHPAGLVQVIERLRIESPGFVGTPWPRVDGSFERKPSGDGPIGLREIGEASFHAPGLVYDRGELSEAVEILRWAIDTKLTMALVYPQVVLASWATVCGSARWWPITVSSEGHSLPSGIDDGSGRGYWMPESRLAQAISFDAILKRMLGCCDNDLQRRAYRRLLRWNAQSIYDYLRKCLLPEADLKGLSYLDREVLRRTILLGSAPLGSGAIAGVVGRIRAR
jgi:glycosyltransferase involved in cell wall biosynthesis